MVEKLIYNCKYLLIMSNTHLYHALKALQEATHNVIQQENLEKVENVIQTCAIIAAVSGVGGGMLPGAGGVVLTVASVAAIWGMYVKINKELDISISENTLKSLASAMLTNLIAGAGASLVAIVATTIIGFIPGLHFLAIPAEAMIAYVTVFASGILYIKFLTKVFKAKGKFDVQEGEKMDQVIADVIRDTNMKSMIDDVKESYKQDKKDGKLKK